MGGWSYGGLDFTALTFPRCANSAGRPFDWLKGGGGAVFLDLRHFHGVANPAGRPSILGGGVARRALAFKRRNGLAFAWQCWWLKKRNKFSNYFTNVSSLFPTVIAPG
jgi:hypothetical protein